MPTLLEAKETATSLSLKALAISEDATTTMAEKAVALEKIEPDIDVALKEVQTLEKFEVHKKNLQSLQGIADVGSLDDDAIVSKKSLGAQFVQSPEYKALLAGDAMKSGQWSSGAIDLKTTVAEGASQTGTGGALVATPTVLPGVLPILFQRLTINDLLPQGTSTGPLIRYLAEAAVTNAAVPTAEGGAAPESAISFSKVDERIRRIPTILPITDEMLEDWEQTQSYMDGRLRLFIAIDEEAQLLKGDGTGENLVGLQVRSGLATAIAQGATGFTTENAMDAIYRQITAIRITSFLEPDAAVIDPASWQTIMLAKSTTGEYLAGGPFVDTQNQALWGKRAVVTTAQSAATALVGAFGQAAQVFRKGGISVEATNSHVDNFAKFVTVLRASERIGLAVYRPGAFGKVTSLAAV